ncbi:MAG: hypothetical protein KGO96_09835 [Elusimicrobia bacterium]|nr:hypothetical protein [Elusimicrobiota bacterium]MDE2237483.1 hypothetical protein [Elusimicrobiota bacterium]MDE2426189.1 hypothetical protein [Elusimicrobiota bacterium]
MTNVPGMTLYFRFLLSLAAGLVGLGLVLRIVMDELLLDYDAPAAFSAWLREFMSYKHLLRQDRTEDVMLEIEKSRTVESEVRLIERRREQLREIASVESRLRSPAA